jgi:hypothetical protein
MKRRRGASSSSLKLTVVFLFRERIWKASGILSSVSLNLGALLFSEKISVFLPSLRHSTLTLSFIVVGIKERDRDRETDLVPSASAQPPSQVKKRARPRPTDPTFFRFFGDIHRFEEGMRETPSGEVGRYARRSSLPRKI